MTRAGHIPIRTCLACGKRAPQGELLRLALTDDKVRPDPRRRLPGRGVYLCPAPACLAALKSRPGKSRILGQRSDQPDWAGLGADIERVLTRGFAEIPRSN